MKKRIRFNLILIALLAVFTTTLFITFYYYDLFQTQVKDDLKSTAVLLENYDLKAFVKENNTIESGIRITWINNDGSVIYDNDASVESMPNHIDRPEVKQAFLSGDAEAVRMSDTLGMNTFYYAVRLKDQTVLRISKDTSSLSNVFVHSFFLIGCISLFVAGVCIILSRWLTKKFLQPIEATITHLDEPGIKPEYKELIPFITKIKKQHEDILASAKIRQDFSANVSHELKTPLTVISGNAELIENDIGTKEQQKHFASEIRRNAERLVTLINDIIKLSELDSENEIEFVEVNLHSIIESILPTLENYASKKSVTIHYEGEDLYVMGNPTLLEELVFNLCQNAIQYNKIEGTVNISLTQHNGVEFIVSDTGIGIPVSDQEHVFERFYRVDKSRSKKTGGTGLGLAIVKHIADLHHAMIRLESVIDEGTTIYVLFE